MNDQNEKIMKDIDEAYGVFVAEMERIKKEHREKINEILRRIDDRKIEQLKEELK